MYKITLRIFSVCMLLHFGVFAIGQCIAGSPDSDSDGVCDAEDICPNVDDSLIGTSCDDGNICTTNDVWTSDCKCKGTLLSDEDNDGICDTEDQCPNFNDNLDIDDDGIPYCMDDCIDVNENNICDNIDNNAFTNKLEVHFSHKRGFYDNSFQLELISNKPNAIIKYTTDNSAPSANNGIEYTNIVDITTSTVVRAITYLNGDTAKIETRSFLFADHVATQQDPSNDFPVSVELSESFTQNNAYNQQFKDALLDIPSMSLSLDFDDFETIYTNKGIEKAANIEFIDSKEGESYSRLAGVNTYGNTSFAANNANKKNYRFKFKEIFGDGKFKYPILGKDAAQEFDVIDLRAGSQETIDRGGVQNIHEQFLKNLQLKISNEAVKGRFVHLYINGKYWGVYTLSERPNKSFGESYYGGNKDDYNTIKSTCCNGAPQAIDGTVDSYVNMINETSNYATINDHLDVKHFIDYVLVCNFGPHGDWTPWNTYVLGDPDNGVPYRFFVWDPEPSLYNDWYYTDYIVNTRFFENIWQPLKDNIDFRMEVADGLECNCVQEDGALFKANVEKDYTDIFDAHKFAYMMECARWADLNLYNEFLDYRDFIVSSNWFGTRRTELINAYRDNDIYSDLDAVTFSTYGGKVELNHQLILTNPNNAGTIYYTTDGSDPRSPGGGLSNTAQVYNQAVILNNGIVTVKARIKDSDNWSAMCPRTFYVNQNYGDLTINEINYNPRDSIFFNPDINAIDTVSGKNFEFVEIKNTGSYPIHLYQSEFTKGINLIIENNLIIPANGFAVFAEDAEWFEARYGFAPDGVYEGQLDDEGEKINLKDPYGYFIDTLRYSHQDPWDEAPNDGYFSLELLHPTFDNREALNWFRSDNTDGTPKAENSRICEQATASIVINEINYNSDNDNFDSGDWVELYNPTGNSIDLSGWTFYDKGEAFIIPQGTNIPADSYLVLVEDAAAFSSAFPDLSSDYYIGDLPFSFSNKGERLSLFENNKCLIDYVIYDDKSPWPVEADGEGPTLSLIDHNLDNALGQYWNASDSLNSYFINGSPAMSNLCPGINTNPIFCSQVIASEDDAEEKISDGSVTITSKDLDLGDDEGVIFKVGMRFQNIDIPHGATITSATIQFAADEINTAETSITFKGENVDNALPFEATDNNISNRNTTSNSVIWQPNPWNIIGENNANQKSADLSPIIQEIINRAGYISGNAIAIIAEVTGIRTAEAFDGSPDLAPKLCITYTTGTCVVNAKIWLEGFYDEANNNMHTKLKDNDLLPFVQPFSAAPWNYQGTETVTTFPENTVDWILIMRRDSDGNILEQSAGLINQNGELMNLDGSLGIPLPIIRGDYISIHHRSHLDILSSNSYDGISYDFTNSADQALGGEQLKLIDGKYMLYAGDFDGKGIINSDDFNNWKIQSAIINQYIPIDGDGNGIVNVMDFNLWIINRSKVGHPFIRF